MPMCVLRHMWAFVCRVLYRLPNFYAEKDGIIRGESLPCRCGGDEVGDKRDEAKGDEEDKDDGFVRAK